MQNIAMKRVPTIVQVSFSKSERSVEGEKVLIKISLLR
jgi:hypothetical protein